MGFWNNLFNRKDTGNKSGFEPSLGSGFQFSDDPVNSNAAIYGVISRLSNTIATLPLNLFNAERQPVSSEDVSVLVGREPNPIFSSFDLWNKAETDRNELGNAFILIERDEYYQPMRLWNINANDVVVLQDQETNALFYRIRVKSNSIVVDSSNVIHLKNITGSNRLMGISPLNVLSDSLKYDQAFEQFSLSEMMKRDSFSITYDKNLDDDRRNAVVESIKSFVKNNGGVLFNEPGAEVELMQRSIATTDVARNDNTFYRRVANAFHVPLSFLNATEATVDSENNMMYFVQMTLMPILKQYEFELNKKLLTDSQKRAGTLTGVNINVNKTLTVATGGKITWASNSTYASFLSDKKYWGGTPKGQANIPIKEVGTATFSTTGNIQLAGDLTAPDSSGPGYMWYHTDLGGKGSNKAYSRTTISEAGFRSEVFSSKSQVGKDVSNFMIVTPNVLAMGTNVNRPTIGLYSDTGFVQGKKLMLSNDPSDATKSLHFSFYEKTNDAPQRFKIDE
ncbi:phage portal protein [Weissella coleopterorum]|uniref:Phage portal protein n=1 Tax=Weissella coleopterorum TaxID=2714949 RepID=A0A6G8AZX7_9LACO|nr:phage portal protein [Weissella coleopterorum]QIL50515.1 phage portal protein [Weissella coleopterorum]